MGEINRSDFKLERYKFILQEIHSLNENINKYLALFQTLSTAIIGGGISLFVSWKGLNINPDIARIGIQGLLGLLIILTFFVIIAIIVGVMSWFDYRKEEVELLNEIIGPKFRSKPTAKNFWRWHETYIILFIIIVVVFIFVFSNTQLLPKIK